MSVVLLVLAVVAAVTGPVAAEDPFAQVATSSMIFLSFPQGPRNFAMGRTGVADDESPSNVFYNPANIAFFDRVYWSANYLDWPSNIYFFDIGVFGGHAFELSGDRTLYVASAVRYIRMDINADIERTIFLPEGTTREFDATDWAAPLCVAVGLSTNRIDVGVGSTVTFAFSELADETVDATGINVGGIARTRFTPWDGAELCITGGVSAINLGNGPTSDGRPSDLPLEYRAGIGVRLAGYNEAPRGPAALWRVNGNIENVDTDTGEDISAGLEFGVLDTAFLRVGHIGDELSLSGDYWGVGISARIGSVALFADYARSSTPILFTDEEPQCFALSGSYRY
jgi:hypothetical protein